MKILKSIPVKYQGLDCLVIGREYYKGCRAMVLLEEDPHALQPSMAIILVPENLSSNKIIHIKEYEQNKGITRSLMDAGVIEKEISSTYIPGVTETREYRLTDEAMGILWTNEWEG